MIEEVCSVCVRACRDCGRPKCECDQVTRKAFLMNVGDWVIHRDTGTLGKVKYLHAPGEYTSPINGKPVPNDIVELDGGHTFLRYKSEWDYLTSEDVAFLNQFSEATKGLIAGAGSRAAMLKLPAARAAAAIRYVLERQARKLPLYASDPGITPRS